MYNYRANMGSRQVPSMKTLTSEKDYCDLLYAWIQCNSDRVSPVSAQRKIEKKKVKFTKIESDFTRSVDGEEIKIMSKYSISKYFKKLIEWGLIYEEVNDKEYYYITLLAPEDANLIEYRTLEKLMNVLQKRAISIYVYLYNTYFAKGQTDYDISLGSIKKYIGIANSTTSNNHVIVDTFDVLQCMGLLSYELKWHAEEEKSIYHINWVKNELQFYEW